MGFNMLRKHIKVEPDRCMTVPSFSCSSAFCPAPLLCTPQGGAWLMQSKTCHLAVLFVFMDRILSTKAASRLTPVTLLFFPMSVLFLHIVFLFFFANAWQGDNSLIPQPANTILQLIRRAHACALSSTPWAHNNPGIHLAVTSSNMLLSKSHLSWSHACGGKWTLPLCLEAEVAMLLWQQSCQDVPTSARLNPETSIVVQKHHPYTGNLNSAMSGDGQNAFLHCGEVGILPHFEA